MQLSCMESSSGLTAQPLFLWITQANFDNFSMQKMLCCGILLMFSLLQRLKICWGTNWGRNFAGQKKKRANIESLFIPYRRFRFPKI